MLGDGQGRVNYEIVKGLLCGGHEVTVVSERLNSDLRGDVRWWRCSVGPLPTHLLRLQVFAIRSRDVLRNVSGIVHVNGFVTWAASDVNTAHFVHSAWLRSPHHIWRQSSDSYAAYQWLYTRLNASWERRAFERSCFVVAVSEKVRQELVSHANVDPLRLRVIRNGVDPEEFHPRVVNRASLGLASKDYLLLFVGGLRLPRKNMETVLRSLALLPDVRLAVVGDASNSPYPSMADRLGVAGRVSFLGFRRDVADVMAAADAFVFPSHYEPDALVLREAMATALPVVTASSVGGADVLNHGETGFILQDETDAAMLAAHVAWLRDHPAQARTMGQRARDVAVRHSWRAMSARYLALYEEIAERKG